MRLAPLLLMVAVLAVCAGCRGSSTASSDPTPAAVSATAQVKLRVMTFNLFYGGDEINLATGGWCTKPAGCREGLHQIEKAIRLAHADVVGLEEAVGNAGVVAQALGWNVDLRTGIISRYPLIEPAGANGDYVYVQVAPGNVVAMGNVHLPSSPYGPYLVRDGAKRARVMALEENTRMPALRPLLPRWKSVADTGVPVFLTGDFNSPSYLDWTPAVSKVRPAVPYPMPWPVSTALARAGFKDSYRVVYPDPIAVPGFTWTYTSPEAIPASREVFDRIDWVLSLGAATPTASQIVGESDAPDVAIALDPWPSDHRAVVSTFRVTAHRPPNYVGLEQRSVAIGTPAVARFQTGSSGQVALVAVGADAGQSPTGRCPASPTTDHCQLPTTGASPGAHDVVLSDGSGAEIARTRVWLHAAGAEPSVTSSKPHYGRGEPIVVRFQNAPGMRWDWLGLFRVKPGSAIQLTPNCKTGECNSADYLEYVYTHSQISGIAKLPGQQTAGTYEVRLLLDDGYQSVAATRFTVG